MRHRRKLHRNGGFTLVETAVACAILAVGVVSLTAVASTSVRLHQAGEQKTIALRNLEAQVATIENTAFANLMALNGTTFAADGAIAPNVNKVVNGKTVSVNSTTSGTITVTAPTNNSAELLQATVSLTWQGTNGSHTMTRRIRRSRLGG